jgi:hypothetical protein
VFSCVLGAVTPVPGGSLAYRSLCEPASGGLPHIGKPMDAPHGVYRGWGGAEVPACLAGVAGGRSSSHPPPGLHRLR